MPLVSDFFLPLDSANFLAYFHWINSLHHWYLSHLLILPPGFLIFVFFNHIVIMFIIFPYWCLSSASHRPCPPPLMLFLMLTASTDEVLTRFLVNFWVFISSIFIVFRSSQFACCVFILCCWLLDSCFFSSVLLIFPLCCLPSLYFFF